MSGGAVYVAEGVDALLLLQTSHARTTNFNASIDARCSEDAMASPADHC